MKWTRFSVSLLILGCATVGPVSHLGWKNQVVIAPVLDAQETFFEINAMAGKIYLRGYQPSITKAGQEEDASRKLVQLVKDKKLCSEVYNFETIRSESEKALLFESDGKKIPVYECFLNFTQEDLAVSLEDFFSHLFRSDLLVSVGDTSLGVNYFGRPIKLSSDNSDGHFFMNGKDPRSNRSAIFWKTNLKSIYGVIRDNSIGYDYPLNQSVFKDSILSAGSANKRLPVN